MLNLPRFPPVPVWVGSVLFTRDGIDPKLKRSASEPKLARIAGRSQAFPCKRKADPYQFGIDPVSLRINRVWEFYIMSVPSLLLTDFFLFLFCLLLIKNWPQVFLAVKQQETALSEAKTKVSHRCGLNYSLLSFKIYWHLPPDFMDEHRL